jgi:glucose/arabinose dehydrogenase
VLRGLAVLLAVIAVACGQHKSATQKAASAREKQARDVAHKAGLAPDVQDFLALYASAAGHKFSVTYAKATNGTTVVLIQDPPRRRVDVVSPPVTRSVFVTAKGTFDCALQDQKWACETAPQQEAAPGLLAPGDITRTAAELKAARTNYTFKVTSKKVAGTDASCLSTTPKKGVTGEGSTLCLSPEGAVLLVEGNGNPLKAARYSTTVDERLLQLPASPEPPQPNP